MASLDGLSNVHVPIFVGVDWLRESLSCNQLTGNKVVVIDATWSLPNQKIDTYKGYIPESRVFDVERLKQATTIGDPYPPSGVVAHILAEQSITPKEHIVIYDQHGTFSSPYIWWAIRSIGHVNTSILLDGLPAWTAAGYPLADGPIISPTPNPSPFPVYASLSKGVTMAEVLQSLGGKTQIIDARPEGRFYGLDPEPRPGLRSGHIPGSLNLPLGVLTSEDGRLVDNDDVLQAVANAGIDLSRPLITTCGSGVTASALAALFARAGKSDVSVYHGSWTEWGASDNPIETSP